MDSEILWIWLQQAVGVGAPQSEAILQSKESIEALYERTSYPDEWMLTASQRRRLMQKDLSEATAEHKALAAQNAFVITPEDTAFFAVFKGMYAPPLVLYGKGAYPVLYEAPGVAVVGTRYCDEKGILVTRCLAAGLAAGGAVVITGGAKGLDSEAMKAALDEGGRCLSFQACGIDVDYPKAVSSLRGTLLSQGGTLLTEFPLGMPALRHHFKIRNRLISAVAHGTLVTQAPVGSGALLTASWAREQGRDVFAAPGSATDECNAGSNELLKDGAKLVTCAADILMEYVNRFPQVIDIQAAVAAETHAREMGRRESDRSAPEKQASPSKRASKEQPPREVHFVPCPANASGDAQRVYGALTDVPQAVSDLARELGMPAPTVMSALTVLELQGAVRCEVGQRYAIRQV